MEIQPVTLEGKLVRLEPLAIEHVEALWSAAQDEEVWRYLRVQVRRREELDDWVRDAVRLRESAGEIPFAIVERQSGNPIGSTRYFDIMPQHRNLEIGHTWLGKQYWRSGVNTEAKYLLLRHAFETMGCVRVQFKTDRLNVRSQTAIKRLGAVEEGTLRKHVWVQNQRFRDSVYFSILDDEWPAVKARLEGLMRDGFP
jgi:RimJ/RimL family protein N-acetyltransferase